jgi:hypothetical protein
LLDYGLEGYGLYWYCLELIVGKIDVDNITFELEHDARIIARNTGSTAQKVEEMMRYFIAQGLFESSQSGNITCMKLAKRLDKSMTSNAKMRELIDKIRGKNHDSVMISHDDSMINPDEVMQDKIRIDKNRLDNKKKRSPKADAFEPSAKLTYSQRCFGIFWDNVERKRVGKAEALKSFEKYTAGKNEDEIDFILNVVCHWYELYLQEDESRLLPENKKYLKGASVWLNAAPWKADPQAYAEFKKQYYEGNDESQSTN